MINPANIPTPIKELGMVTMSKASNKFVDYIIYRSTGKSSKVFDAQGDVEADKVQEKWELEKPFWKAMELEKLERQYSNMGRVLNIAAPQIEATEPQDLDDNDVFWALIEHAKEISHEDVQVIIAGLLSGEYNAPGSYGMGTLRTLRALDGKELKSFESICSLLVDKSMIPRDIFLPKTDASDITSKIGIDFRSFKSLQMTGLILPGSMFGNSINTKMSEIELDYFGKKMIFRSNSGKRQTISLPSFYGLSIAGEDILKHLNPCYVDAYYIWLLENYQISGYTLADNLG